MQGRKRCSRCGEAKPLTEFDRHARGALGRQAYCRDCRRIYNYNYRYGITVAQYDAMLEAQQGGCAICHEPGRAALRLAVDHDHRSGVVRGLLCRACNLGVGHFLHRTELLQAAIDYLNQTKDGAHV